MDQFEPTRSDRFTFGLWTIGNPGADPFGAMVRPVQDPCRLVHWLAEWGAFGVNLHDNDLIPFGATAADRQRIVRDFQKAVAETGLAVPMVTTNLFHHPVFKDGAFTANDPRVRSFALKKTMEAIDLGAELGAEIFVFWGGREGSEADACRDPRVAIARLRDAMNFLCGYVRDQRYSMRFALEAKPNEPRGDLYLATTGHMLHFISTLEHPDMVGVNPEVAHETMSGLSIAHAVAQALESNKLFHIDLNAQKIGRFDQDLRFGSEDLKGAFLLVRLLEGTAGGESYRGPLHFDAHAYRTEDEKGIREFARGCMRTYKILHERARAFDADAEVKSILCKEHETLDPLLQHYSHEAATRLKHLEVPLDTLAREGLGYERLDQLMMEHLLGVRA